MPINILSDAKEINYTGHDDLFKKLDIETNYKGLIKDESIILLQVDKLTNFMLNKKYNDKNIMTNTHKLLKEESEKGVIYFNNYYEDSIPKSTELEFSVFNSLYPHPNVNSLKRNRNRKTLELPKILQKEKYQTYYLNTSKIYHPENLANAQSIGFNNTLYLGSDNDKIFSKIEELIKTNSKKFIYANIDFGSNFIFENNNDIKSDNRLKKEISYLKYVDTKINELIKTINNSDNKYTLIVYGTNGNSHEDLNLKNNYPNFYRYYTLKDELNMPLIIKRNVNTKTIKINTLCSSIDIMPTILHLINYEGKTYPMMGEVLFNKNLGQRNIAFQNQLNKGSFINEDILFKVNKINENYIGLKITDKNFDIKKLLEISTEVIKNINLSNGICDLDILEELSKNYYANRKMQLDNAKTIMHAGGAINGISYSNLKEALDYNYSRGKRYFEIDFSKTNDNRYVGLHSWDGFLKKFFDVDPMLNKDGSKKAFGYDKFMSFEEVHGYTQMDVKLVMEWLKNHKDAYIVTDCKGDNVDLLREIKQLYNGDLSRVIVQIYDTKEYQAVKNMGFNNIIFTLYRTDISEEEIIKFANSNKLLAVTINEHRYKAGYGKKIINSGINLFIHTINDLDDANAYLKQGVSAIYTDIL